jgi:hypothetical protein
MKKICLSLIIFIWAALLAVPVQTWAAGSAQGGDTPTPAPTYTPQPTYTPLPTYTPFPTPAPQVQPTAVPTVEPETGFQAGGQDGKFVFGGTYTLRSGEWLSGDLVVFGGTVTLQGDTRVDGNIVVIGGTIDVEGRVRGDVVLIGGTARLRSTAEVDGQLVRVGGTLTRDPGVQIYGGETGGAEVPPIPIVPRIAPTPRPFEVQPNWGLNLYLSFVGRVLRGIATTIVLSLLALFVVSLWREPLERVNRTVTQSPGISWVAGFLTPVAFAVIVPAVAVLSAILILALCLGLVGFLLIAAVSLALVAAWAMGWIAVGQVIGERLLTAMNTRNVTPAASAILGTAIITLLWLGLEPLCGLGWVFFVVLAPLGLGAVVLTRFGTREYTNGHSPFASVVPVPPTPPVAPEPPQFRPVEPAAPAADAPSDESKPADES